MPRNDLRQWLLAQPGFQRQIDALIRTAVSREFPKLQLAEPLAEHDWPYLLLCGSALARSEKTDEQRVALRFADTCLQLETTSEEERAAAAIVIDTMANRRTVALAAERRLVSEEIGDGLPLPLRADFLRREAEDSIVGADGVRMPVNRFQSEFWRASRSFAWVSASAPTSAGKSFLLRVCAGSGPAPARAPRFNGAGLM